MADSQVQQNVKITIHWLQSSRAQRLLVLLEELHLNYEIKTYARDDLGLAPDSLKKIHPIGHSPIIVVELPGEAPIVLAESGAIFEYLTQYWGQNLVPRRTVEGKEGTVGVETEEYRRNRYFMHYSEGSLMPWLTVAVVFRNLTKAPAPFFIKPLIRMINRQINEILLTPNFKTHFDFLEGQLKTSPGGGPYLCGTEMTEGDLMMLFPVEASIEWAGLTEKDYPAIMAFLSAIKGRESYKRAEKKVLEIEGSFKPVF